MFAKRATAADRSEHDLGEGVALGAVAEAEVRGREGVRPVLERGDRVVRTRGRVVDRRHVERDGVGGRVEIDAAVRRSARVPDAELEAAVGGAVRA